MDPTVGRIVIYRSKAGLKYVVPAIIAATEETLLPEGVEAFKVSDGAHGVPPLTGLDNVHLIVFSPGVSDHAPPAPLDANAGGTYREHDVPFDDGDGEQAPGTWRWPERR